MKNVKKIIAQVLTIGGIVLFSIAFSAINMFAAFQDRKLPAIVATYVGPFCKASTARATFGATDRVSVPGSSEVLCVRRPFFYIGLPDPGDKVLVVHRYANNATQTGVRAAYYLGGWWWVLEMAVASLLLLPSIGIALLLVYTRQRRRDRGPNHDEKPSRL